MWSPIHNAEDRMERLVEHFSTPGEAEIQVLNQAARELLLIQSSDWQSLVTSGLGRAYAIRRFSEHAERFDRLVSSLERGEPDVETARYAWERDNVFADMDYRWFSTK